MNTLKIKVLLIISNRYLFRSVGKAMLTWFGANLLGCTILWIMGFFFIQSPEEFLMSLLLSLIFSSPAIVIAAWVLYALPLLKSWFKRTSVSAGAILITSAGIIAIVARYFHLDYLEVAHVLYPFTLSAIACFFFIARKQFIPLPAFN